MNMNLSATAHSILVAVLLGPAPLPLCAQTRTPPPLELPKPSESRLFDFSGGTPAEFLSAVDKTFGVEWSQIAAIPEKARALRIPPMRMRVSTAEAVLSVANKLTAETPSLGTWITIPGQGTISAVLYKLGPSLSSPPSLEVRAVSLRDVPSEKWDDLLRLLDESLAQVLPSHPDSKDAAASPVNIRIHRTAAMLMITATKEYIERVEPLVVALRGGMAQAPGTGAAPGAFAASKLVPLAGVALGNAKDLEGILGKATEAWMSAQAEQGAKAETRGRFTFLPDLGGVLLVGPREWIEFAGQVAAEWVAKFADGGEAALAEGLKARAFSIAGLPPKTVDQVVAEVQAHSQKLRVMQQDLANRTGRVLGGGVVIYGNPEPVGELQVLLVTGNEAGLEFARSFIEETKAGIEKAAATHKFVTVGGAVRAPQRIFWTPDLTALSALSAVGGLLDSAKDTIRLIRGQETRTLNRKEMIKDPKKDQSLQPGDRLEVDE
jgi:hypothetical protein